MFYHCLASKARHWNYRSIVPFAHGIFEAESAERYTRLQNWLALGRVPKNSGPESARYSRINATLLTCDSVTEPRCSGIVTYLMANVYHLLIAAADHRIYQVHFDIVLLD